LTWLVALTTVQHYHADCDKFIYLLSSFPMTDSIFLLS